MRQPALSVPAVVVHGAVDNMLPLRTHLPHLPSRFTDLPHTYLLPLNTAHGEATAAAIPNCELVVIEDLGHDIPPPLWEKMIEPFDRNARRALELAAANKSTSAPTLETHSMPALHTTAEATE
mgnify:CR=1 FL=1